MKYGHVRNLGENYVIKFDSIAWYSLTESVGEEYAKFEGIVHFVIGI